MTFLRNAWYCAAWSDEVTRSPLARTILNERIVLYRRESGEGVVALGGVCPHRFASMETGKLHGDLLACPYHGLRFAEGGRCVHNPHGDVIPPALRVNGYPVEDRYGVCWIWMGEPDRADTASIPDFAEQTDPRYRVVRGLIPVDGSYELVSDNLLDLSHTQYLHEFLAHEYDEEDGHSLRIVQDGDRLETFHDTFDTPRYGFINAVWPDGPQRTDNYGGIIWNAPANMKLKMRFCAAGQDPDEGIRAWGAELVTPATETTCHYFWSFCRNFRLDDDALDALLMQAISHVFTNEDAWMIAGLQRNMGAETDLLALRPVILPTDEAALRARRILRRLIRRERGEDAASVPDAAAFADA